MNVQQNATEMKKLSFIALCLFVANFCFANSVEVTGKVSDKETGQILRNCHVFINPHFGTITDEKGNFKLEIPEIYKDETLKISFLGFETFEIAVKELNGNDLKVKLNPAAYMLDDIVVVTPDPWDDFRFIIGELSDQYDTKRELYAAVFDEMEKMEVEKQYRASETVEYRGENMEGGLMSGVIAFCLTAVLMAFVARPIVKMVSKNHRPGL